VIIPFGFSIADGIGFGILAHCAVRAAQRRTGELSWLLLATAILFVLRFWLKA
jgi:AGZA family xanthine/uracil permease-like MFS transporter